MIRMFHGSPRENARSILKQGILKDPPAARLRTRTQCGIYLSTLPGLAATFAAYAASRAAGQPIVTGRFRVAVFSVLVDEDDLVEDWEDGSPDVCFECTRDVLPDQIIGWEGVEIDF